jgi:hypothetical protein
MGEQEGIELAVGEQALERAHQSALDCGRVVAEQVVGEERERVAVVVERFSEHDRAVGDREVEGAIGSINTAAGST